MDEEKKWTMMHEYFVVETPELNISYKPQKISPKFSGTVRDLLNSKIRDAIFHPQFQTDVSRPLQIDNIIDQEVRYFDWHHPFVDDRLFLL